jgi:hypothetical protein
MVAFLVMLIEITMEILLVVILAFAWIGQALKAGGDIK